MMPFSPSHGVLAGAVALSAVATFGGVATLGVFGHQSGGQVATVAAPGVLSEPRGGSPTATPGATPPGAKPPAEAPASPPKPAQGGVIASGSPTEPTKAPAPKPTPTPSQHPTPPAGDGIIRSDGQGHLTLNGQPYQFVGVDAFQIATMWSINYGCGSYIPDIDGFFTSLTPNSVVRFWAFQDFTQSKVTGGRDWTPIDRVVHAAERAHQRLVLVFADQWANCHGEQYKDAAFYNGGYRAAIPPGELEPYWNWVRDVVTRYKASPAVGMWEPLNESQGDCITIWRGELWKFFDAVGGLIKSIDSTHLVESGLLGTGQCGTTGIDYTVVQNTTNLDVVSYHDYGDASPLPGSLAERLQEARAMNKPLVVGEVGFPGLGQCDAMHEKQPAQFAAGVAGFLPWNWGGPGDPTCGF